MQKKKREKEWSTGIKSHRKILSFFSLCLQIFFDNQNHSGKLKITLEMDTYSFACKNWKISGTGEFNWITNECGLKKKGNSESNIVFTLLYANIYYLHYDFYDYTSVCFSSEEHTLFAVVWQPHHHCLPHVGCALHPLYDACRQAASGNLLIPSFFLLLFFNSLLFSFVL